MVGSTSELEFHPRPEDDPSVRCPDTSLARQTLGWNAEIPLGEGLKRTLPWFREKVAA